MNGVPLTSQATAVPDPAPAGADCAGAAFHAAPLAMFVADSEGRIRAANADFLHLAATTPAEVLGRKWPELMTGDGAESAWALHAAALEVEAGPHRPLDLLVGHGRTRRILVQLRPLGGSILGVCSDPPSDSEALRTFAELRVESGDSAMWSLDLSTGELQEIFGPSPLGRWLIGDLPTLEGCLARVHPEDVARLRHALEAARGGEDYEQRFRMFDQSGEERWLHARAHYVPGGGSPRLVGMVEDVTEQVQLVRRLAERRRLEDAWGRRINELAARFISATTSEEICTLLTEEFMTTFHGDATSGLFDKGGSSGFLSKTVLAGADPFDTAYPAGAVFAEGEPRFLDSEQELLELFPAASGLHLDTGARAWALVPLFGDQQGVLGVWQVSWHEEHRITSEERAVLLTLAGLAGQALQRVRNQAGELELADAMQRRMLPAQPLSVPGVEIAVRYLPARAGWRVCGDFYDAIPLPGRSVGLLVGDVQGHGVEAAAAMGQIRLALRAYASTHADPGTVLAETNRLLTEALATESGEETLFTTCGYLVLDLDTGEMHAAWAGQPPALIAAPGTVRLWQPCTGPPVGVEAESVYPVTRRVLRPEETLLMCSDGLVESSVLAMEEGLAAVGRTLRGLAADVEVAAAALERLAPAGRGDDIALLLARRG